MLNGLSVKSTVWTYKLFLTFLFLLFSVATIPPTASADISTEIAAFRREVSALTEIVPSIPYPDPGPSDIEDMSRTSPQKASIALNKARKAFRLVASDYINGEIVKTGKNIKSDPTTTENYNERRKLLVALETAARQNNMSVTGLFPKGAPSVHLPKENASAKAYTFCDKTYAYLAKLLFTKLSPGLKSAINAGQSTDKPPGNTSSAFSGSKQTVHNPSPVNSSGSASDKNKTMKNQWQVIGMYFHWILYAFIALSCGGLLHHLLKGWSVFSRLNQNALKTEDEDVMMYQNASSDFKEALKHFKSNHFAKAIEGFSSIGKGKNDIAHNAVFFRILSEISLAQIDRALKEIKEEGYEAFSLEELYRMAHSFEEIGDLHNSLNMYVKVKERDSTFRNIAQRIKTIEQKIEIDELSDKKDD